MPNTTLIIPHNSPLLREEHVQVLHTYSNGNVLAKVEGRIPESADVQHVEGGLQPTGITTSELQRLRERSVTEIDDDAEIYAYTELAGPPEASVVTLLEETGLEVINFEPPAAYLCHGTKQEFAAAAEIPLVTAVIPRERSLKPTLTLNEVGEEDLWVVLYNSSAEKTMAMLAGMDGLDPIDSPERTAGPYVRIPIKANAETVEQILVLPGVASVDLRVQAQPEGEVADLIVAGMIDTQHRPVGNYLRWLEDLNIDGSGVTIGIVDAGVDESHEAFTGRIVAKDNNTTDWHGTFVAGHAAGNYKDERDPNGFIYGIGVAPGADIVSQSYNRTDEENCRDTVKTLGASSSKRGVIQNNSWGRLPTSPAGMDYKSGEALFDGFVRNADGEGTPLTICFSSGNSGASGLTRPKSAKNIIVTGNSESYRPEFVTSKPGDAADADNINHVFTGMGASSHGNCGDGRIRPHVVAPGQWTSSANFDSHPGQREYISPKLTWGGGSSGASPKTAGACALIVDWWRQNIGGNDPSPALLRAAVVNGATDTGFGGPIPNNRQGWGRLNLGNVLDEFVHKTYLDQSILLKAIGETKTWNLQVSDPDKPVKITLAWTDPPGAIGSGTSSRTAIVNRLALELEQAGLTYYGNEFTGGWSRSSSRPENEGLDNVQNIFIPSGVIQGPFTVTVRAVALAMNCLTNKASDPQQDFALVIHNGHLDQSYTPYDMVLLIDDQNADDPYSDDPWHTDDDDGTNDNDDTWGDGKERPTLRKGDSGPDVQDLQQMLFDLGYDPNGIDGKFGTGTRKAVIQFQKDEGLTADGIVGPTTWSHLNAASTANQDDDDWDDDDWDDDDWDDWFDWDAWEGESTRTNGVKSLSRHKIANEIARSVTGIADEGVRLILPANDVNGLTITDAEAGIDALSEHIGRDGIGQLSSALKNLLHQWEEFGNDHEGVIRPRTAVFVIGAHTKFSKEDLIVLRRLAMLGTLFIVSDKQDIMNWLAQRLQLRRGIHYRLILGEEHMASAIKEVLAEAGGATRAILPQRISESNVNRAVQAQLHLTEHDQQATILLEKARNITVEVGPPGSDFIEVTPRSRRQGIRVREISEDILKVTLRQTENGPWAGIWRLRFQLNEERAETPIIDAFVTGATTIKFQTEQLGGPATESDRSRIVGVSVSNGRLARARIRAVSSVENSRSNLEMTPRTDRLLTLNGTQSESDREVATADHLSGLMTTGTSNQTVTDIGIEVQGVSPEGHRFMRSCHENLLKILPRSEWRRQRGRKKEKWDLVRARVSEVVLNQNLKGLGLVIRSRKKRRAVRVENPILQDLLTSIDLSEGEYVFGLEGDIVQTVIDPLQEAHHELGE